MQNIPYISLYGPTLPLLIWTLVAALCGLLLVIEAVVLAVRRGARTSERWLAIVPLAVGLANVVLANQVGAAYLRVACPYNTLSHPLGCFDPNLAAQEVARFQPLGWALAGVTVVLLVAGVAVFRQPRHVAA